MLVVNIAVHGQDAVAVIFLFLLKGDTAGKTLTYKVISEFPVKWIPAQSTTTIYSRDNKVGAQQSVRLLATRTQTHIHTYGTHNDKT